MDRSSRQRINKATGVLNDTTEQLDLIDVFRTLYSKKKGRTCLTPFKKKKKAKGHRDTQLYLQDLAGRGRR